MDINYNKNKKLSFFFFFLFFYRQNQDLVYILPQESMGTRGATNPRDVSLNGPCSLIGIREKKNLGALHLSQARLLNNLPKPSTHPSQSHVPFRLCQSLLLPLHHHTQSFKMYSMRAIARSAPRTLTRISSAALRQSVARPASLARAAAWAPLRSAQFSSPFSTTQLRAKPAGEVDQELSAKLESELQYENELKESEPEPTSIKDFLENSPFELIDTPGKEDVILKRKFGNET
jgi:hypothetical protein